MDKILEIISRLKYQTILLFGGIVFILISMCKFSFENDNFKIEQSNSINYFVFVVGSVFVFLSIIVFMAEYFDIFSTKNIKGIKNGYSVEFGGKKLNVIYGKIETYRCDNNTVIALPIDEFFSKDCILRKNSALNAYVKRHYAPSDIDLTLQYAQPFINLVVQNLSGMPKSSVEKKPNIFEDSYGVGKGIFFNDTNSQNNLILISTSTQRANQGIRSDVSYIAEAVNEVCNIMTNNALYNLYIPVIGSGYGGLLEADIFVLILQFVKVLRNQARPINEVNIVVYKGDNGSEKLNRKFIKSILKSVLTITS